MLKSLSGCILLAVFAGQALAQVDPTVTIQSNLNPSVFGQSVTFTATVTGSVGPATGTVDFNDGEIGICTGVALSVTATCTVSDLSVGSHFISVAYYFGNYNDGFSAPVDQEVNAAPPVAHGDLNGDFRSDMLFRNSATGQVYRALMNGATITSRGFAYTEPNLAWKVVAEADFNGDGIADLLWRNTTTGGVFMLTFAASGLPGNGAFVYSEPNQAWKVVATPDIDGDGKADIVWWNSSTGETYAMLMDGFTIVSQGLFYVEPNTNWNVVAFGDFLGTGQPNQLLWRNVSTGEVWLMEVGIGDVEFGQNSFHVSQTANTAWKIVSAVNAASHKSLVLWRNDATGAIAILPVTASPGSVTALFTEPNLAWKVVAVGDYDGNGTEDLLWRNDSTGHVWMMLMVSPGDSFAITGQALAYYEPNLNWKVLGAWEFAQ